MLNLLTCLAWACLGWGQDDTTESSLQANSPQFVVVISEADLVVGTQIVDRVGPGRVFKVLGASDGLLLVSRGKPGWILQRATADIAQAEPYFANRVEQSRSPEDFMARGNVLLYLGKLEQGLSDLKTAIELTQGRQAIYHEALGFALIASGSQEAAKSSFDRALAIEPQSTWGLMGRGLAYYNTKQLDLARKDMLAASQLSPDHAFPQKYLASICHDEGKFAEAAQHMRKAIELDAYDGYTRKAAGRLLHDLTKYEDALNQFRMAIEFDPRDSEAIAGYGTVLQAMGGDLQQAKGLFQRAIALSSRNPDDAYLWNNLGHVQLELGEVTEAFENLTQAIQLDPTLNEARGLRSWLILTAFSSDAAKMRLANQDVEEILKSNQPKTFWDLRAIIALHSTTGNLALVEQARKQIPAQLNSLPRRYHAEAIALVEARP